MARFLPVFPEVPSGVSFFRAESYHLSQESTPQSHPFNSHRMAISVFSLPAQSPPGGRLCSSGSPRTLHRKGHGGSSPNRKIPAVYSGEWWDASAAHKVIISGCLFLAADIFAIASIANPDWINTGESAGALTVGLVRQCQTIHGRDRTCIPPRLPPEWVTTLFFIIMGIISLTVTCGLLVASHWRREATKYARWIAFTGMILFCMAALIFPIGFYINEVGGQPYKLPNNTVVGSSYVLFVLSIFFTIVGLLFAGKVCLPGWRMSKRLNSFYFFILFFIFRGWEDKEKASGQSSHRKMLRWTWCWKGKIALICSHYALWI